MAIGFTQERSFVQSRRKSGIFELHYRDNLKFIVSGTDGDEDFFSEYYYRGIFTDVNLKTLESCDIYIKIDTVAKLFQVIADDQYLLGKSDKIKEIKKVLSLNP